MINLNKLQTNLYSLAVIVACCVYVGLIFVMLFQHHQGTYYNCMMSEISDFPIEVKEKCRNHKSGRV